MSETPFLTSKKILLGITGGIAAYKSVELIRQLRMLGAEVRVVMTQHAKAFITPLTLQTISGHKVHDALFDADTEASMSHIDLARWADLVLIAPASANFIARITHGLCDDLLSTLCLASTSPIWIAPAMNQAMWHNPANQANCALLKQRGIKILEPDSGIQACGEIGLGRLKEIDKILHTVTTFFSERKIALKKQALRVLITAGPTLEPLDPVRFLSNYSSGKMGYALAEIASEYCESVTLISGPTQLPKPTAVRFFPVKTAAEMHEAVLEHVKTCDVFISAAAVSDYRLEHFSPQKIKKKADVLRLTLIRNPDIVSEVAHLKTHRPFTVGFAAETEHGLTYAREKLQRKNLDIIVLNDVSDTTIGFQSDHNAVTLLTHTETLPLPRDTKNHIAEQILAFILEKYREHLKTYSTENS